MNFLVSRRFLTANGPEVFDMAHLSQKNKRTINARCHALEIDMPL
jgi:hypothetical protein